MFKLLNDCLNDITSGRIFKPLDRIADALWNCLRRHPVRTLKVLVPVLVILFVIGKCSGSPAAEKAVPVSPAQSVERTGE